LSSNCSEAASGEHHGPHQASTTFAATAPSTHGRWRTSAAATARPGVSAGSSPTCRAVACGASPVINFYQINNYADQMINQYQVVSVNNSAPNSVLTVGVDERSTNNGTI
jgi:hypothetical protein